LFFEHYRRFSCAKPKSSVVVLGKADKPKKVTLSEFISEHGKIMKGQVAHGTLLVQMQVLKLFENFIGDSIAMSKIQPHHAEAFIANCLASGLKVATVNKYIRTLRRVFNLAIEPRSYIAEGRNPFTMIKERKKAEKPIRYVTTNEYWALMDAAQSLWWRALISTAYGSGLRRGEILNLTWGDVDFEKQLIRVSPIERSAKTLEWEPKDHESRVVPMSDKTTLLFADLQAQSEEGHPYIFISPRRLAWIIYR